MKSMSLFLLPVTCFGVGYVIAQLRQQAKKNVAVFETFDHTPELHKGEDECIWCGKAFPIPELVDEYDAMYQKAMIPWVMLSFGDDRMPVMACEPLHMELYFMHGPYQEKQ